MRFPLTVDQTLTPKILIGVLDAMKVACALAIAWEVWHLLKLISTAPK
jgi:hypothetical protein